ncbi:MAG: hypothetical protein LBH31_01755 [Burkholderiaceae bacterium]|jgi:hypothetical protein|nr:hypothetical protein [Burkholderiaceae bacterium]
MHRLQRLRVDADMLRMAQIPSVGLVAATTAIAMMGQRFAPCISTRIQAWQLARIYSALPKSKTLARTIKQWYLSHRALFVEQLYKD